MYAQYDGTIYCNSGTPNVSPGNYDFYIKDDNQDGVWDYYWNNGQYLGSYNLATLTSGAPRAEGERRNQSDSAYANFQVLKRMNANKGWALWSGTTVVDDSDPDYRGCIYGNTHYTVKLGSC